MEFKPENESAVIIRGSWANPGTNGPTQRPGPAVAGLVVGQAEAILNAGNPPTPGFLIRRDDDAKGGGPNGEWFCPRWALEPVQLPLGASVTVSLEDGDTLTGEIQEVRYTVDGDRYVVNGDGPFARLELELRELPYRPEVPAAPQEGSCEPCREAVAGLPLNDGARFPSSLPNGSEARKEYPLHTVLFGYFPAAMNALARHSWQGNQKHNPGLPMQHARNKSGDHADCILRHLQEGDYEAVLWRAAALLQEQLEKEGAPVAPRATFG